MIKHLKQMVGGRECGGRLWGFFYYYYFVLFMFLTSLSVCGRPLEFFLFIKLFM